MSDTTDQNAQHAHTITQQTTNEQPTPRFTEDDLNKARQQEKDKLYPEMNHLKENLASLQQRLEEQAQADEARKQVEAEAQARAEEEARKKAEEELSAKEILAQRESEWEKRFSETEQTFQAQLQEFEQQREQERAVLQKERELAELTAYATQRVQEAGETIEPNLVDLVSGNTREEIDASIQNLQARSQRIVESAQQAWTAVRAAQPGVSANGYAPTGPMDLAPTNQQYTAEDIAKMSVAEYADKIRPNIGIGGNATNHGMYG